ncbi:MAG: hypothetical protein VX899_17520 [Myxococcota bacterium]|nr:hypothetical protein [Myxococcota bacterium]
MPCESCAEVAERQQAWLDGCGLEVERSALESDCEAWGAPLQGCLVACMEEEGCLRATGRVELPAAMVNQDCDSVCYEAYGE